MSLTSAFTKPVLALASVALLLGVFSSVQAQSDPREQRIQRGDVLQIRIAGIPHDWGEPSVDETGILGFPLVEQGISVACMTPTQLANKLTEAYAKYLRKPQVSVAIKEQPFHLPTVTGAVKQEMRFDLRRRTTVNELIALAGGPTEYFSGNITVSRPAGWTCEGDQVHRTQAERRMFRASGTATEMIPSDLEALPRMRIDLELKPLVFVIGNVARPRILVLEPNLTIMWAIAMAGGTLPDTLKDKVHITRVRPGTTQRWEIPINIATIEKGKGLDLVLEDNDIVEVPSRHDRHGDSFVPLTLGPPPVTVVE